MKKIFYAALLLLTLAAYAQPRLAYNGGFEVVKAQDALRYWRTNPSKGEYSFSQDSLTYRNGRYALRLEGQKAVRTANPQMGGGFFYIVIPEELLAGKKRATLEAWVRTDGPRSLAGIWFNQFGGSPNMNASFTDTTKTIDGWQRLQLEATLTPGAKETYFGGKLNGTGKVWFDDFALSLDGEQVTDAATPARPPSPAEIAWIDQAAVPLLGVDPQKDTRDLNALSRWMGDARVVAVGEPTHGTNEVFRLRLRLLQYLVEQKGFNTLMLEDNLAEVGLMNRYVLTGSDTALRVLRKHFFTVWKNEEMLALIEWMRHYNRTHGTKLQFRGMDMQRPRLAVQNVKRFAGQYDPRLLDYVVTLTRLDAQMQGNTDKAVRSRRKDSLIQLSGRLRNHVGQHLPGYRAKAPRDSVHWLALNADVVAQYYRNMDWENGHTYRDSCMAANIITYCRQYPRAKLLIWAHNSHVSRTPGFMGNWLGTHLGKEYFPVAFATATGTYTASVDFPKTAWKAYPLEEPYVGTAEYYLQQAKPANYLLPLPPAGASPEAANWLGAEHDFRFIGFMNLSDQFSPANLREAFDAIIFMKQTTHAKSFLFKKE